MAGAVARGVDRCAPRERDKGGYRVVSSSLEEARIAVGGRDERKRHPRHRPKLGSGLLERGGVALGEIERRLDVDLGVREVVGGEAGGE